MESLIWISLVCNSVLCLMIWYLNCPRFDSESHFCVSLLSQWKLGSQQYQHVSLFAHSFNKPKISSKLLVYAAKISKLLKRVQDLFSIPSSPNGPYFSQNIWKRTNVHLPILYIKSREAIKLNKCHRANKSEGKKSNSGLLISRPRLSFSTSLLGSSRAVIFIIALSTNECWSSGITRTNANQN